MVLLCIFISVGTDFTFIMEVNFAMLEMVAAKNDKVIGVCVAVGTVLYKDNLDSRQED